ncbi:MAG: hypothetical protein COV45_02550 [Deltaproteobacteria bacterium CG11_big_fil_rev_8_21_14_0_20_47_16]|nr:MAG: hypothetical protein COV45_02550 [Deltaproteobacteria bacterium CG11_big_fil_rev_8_21_14_0_20_47_16]
MSDRHIILVGFKHVGKTAIGRALADKQDIPFYELDAWVEDLNHQRTGKKQSCREIVASQGEAVFRALETQALEAILHAPEGVIDLGGGAPMTTENQKMISGHHVVHISAPEEVVFARVSEKKWPQIFAGAKPSRALFQSLWQDRKVVYEHLAMVTIMNDDLIDTAVQKIMEHLK